MIRCVMFDFGNVLAHFDAPAFYNFLRTHQHPDSRNVKDIFNGLDCFSISLKKIISDFDLGRISTDEMFNRLKKALDLNVGKSEFLSMYINVIKPDTKMILLRKIIRRNGVKLAVVSNINNYHYRYVKILHPAVFDDFDFLMLSYQRGFKKPDRRMWEMPAAQLKVQPEECFFIDDLEENIAAFEQWGGIGHYYDVVDENYCPNGKLETERDRLIVRMINLGILSSAQAGRIANIK